VINVPSAMGTPVARLTGALVFVRFSFWRCVQSSRSTGTAVRDRILGSDEVVGALSLALIGNASAEICGGRAGCRAEAFSIRRLEGSRWRLRRTLWDLNRLWRGSCCKKGYLQNDCLIVIHRFSGTVTAHDYCILARVGLSFKTPKATGSRPPSSRHAKRPPRQRLSSCRPLGNNRPQSLSNGLQPTGTGAANRTSDRVGLACRDYCREQPTPHLKRIGPGKR
jgi:hypothetical protein